MQGKSELNNTQNKDDFINNDEIDLLSISKIILRNKWFISQIAFISLIGGIFYSFSARKIWEGQFQIVLTKNNNSFVNNSLLNRSANSFDGISIQGLNIRRGQDPLRTKVGILKSPLILNKVFNYVKEEKAKNKKNNINNITFNDWKKNSLIIKLEQNTSILNLSYRDKNKELIIPVLDKISRSYQDYSGRNRSREINLGITFLENQIDKYKINSANSAREAQEFALKEDLAILKGKSEIDKKIPNQINTILKDESEIDKEIPNQINIEKIRIESGNNIRNFETQLRVIKNINDPEKLISFIELGEDIIDAQLIDKLREIETDIQIKKTVYKENDILIQDLLRKRDNLIQLYKQQAISVLNAKILSEKGILSAADRPKGVIIKYRELLGIAKKDAKTLENLEINYRKLLLEKARIEDPWELITSPTLLNNPVFPNKKNIVISTFIFGVFLGSLLSLIIEKRKNIIFSSNIFFKEFNYPVITELSSINEKIFKDDLKLLLESAYIRNQKKVTFIKDTQFKNPYNAKLDEIIRSQNYKIQNLDEFINSKELNDVILMPVLGKIKIDDLKNTFNKLELLGIKVIGIVPIKEDNQENKGINLYDELTLLAKFLFTRFNAAIKNLDF